MRKAEITRALLAGTMLTVLVGLMPAGSARAAIPTAPASRAIRAAQAARANAKPPVRQVITVTAVARTTTYATLRAYQVSAANALGKTAAAPGPRSPGPAASATGGHQILSSEVRR
jgi:hypothetical protein